MDTRIQPLGQLPPNAEQSDTTLYCMDQGGQLYLLQPSSQWDNTTLAVVAGSPVDVMVQRGWKLAKDVGGDPVPLPDAYHRAHSSIFRYAIIHSTPLRDTVCAFLATASGEWSRQRAKGQTPDDWQIIALSNDHEMIVVDSTLAQASQYGSAEAIARQTSEFESVDVVQWLSPDVDWGGMALTNPTNDTQEQYAPGETRINTLGIQQHQQVIASDIPQLAGYTVA